jgi:hypothetical protein
VTELVVAAALLVGTRATQAVALVAVIVLLAGFTAWHVSLRRRRLLVPCRCFGSDAAAGFVASLTRNAALAAVAWVCLLTGGGELPMTLDGLSATVVVGGAILVWMSYGLLLAWPALLKKLPADVDAEVEVD